jgi:hypothetical protein
MNLNYIKYKNTVHLCGTLFLDDKGAEHKCDFKFFEKEIEHYHVCHNKQHDKPIFKSNASQHKIISA